MTKRPSNFITWLAYHRETIGVEHFFLRVEDTEALVHYLETTAPWSTACTISRAGATVRDWKAQSERQNAHVKDAIKSAKAMGFTHLLHIDDDECLYLPSGMPALRSVISSSHGTGLVELHALTLEALAPSLECTNPFAECCAFRHCASDYCSYGRGEQSHGKSIAILSAPQLAPYSPHHFRGQGGDTGSDPAETFLMRTHILPPPVAVILHFESCTYRRWRDKFTEFALRMRHDRSGVRVAATFSLFYKASIEACMRLIGDGGKDGTAATAAEAEKVARAVWSDSKVEPAAVSTSRPIAHARTLGRLTLIPPIAAGVAGSAVATAERQLEQAMIQMSAMAS